MTEPDFSHLADLHQLGDQAISEVVVELASGREFVKWNPRSTGIDLDRERVRLEWISARHPAPRVLHFGSDVSAQWLVLSALPGECAVGDIWHARRAEAIRAIANGIPPLEIRFLKLGVYIRSLDGHIPICCQVAR